MKKCVALFAGIGGIEVGLSVSDIETVMLCEIDPDAQRVLRKRFPNANLVGDVNKIKKLPDCDILTAGFPCQDISQAGPKNGIKGARSGLVTNVFRLIGDKPINKRPEWVVIENVSNIISLHQGEAMAYLTQSFESLGYKWAYRIVDARAFGVPQRRLRMVMVASLHGNVSSALFSQDVKDPPVDDSLETIDEEAYYGFYWTEGRLGLGWAKNSIPTLKNGSTIGIPSPPAIWIPRANSFGTPDIRDAERMQGFNIDWTMVLRRDTRKVQNSRWRQVGNAVCTKMAEWVGKQISKSPQESFVGGKPFSTGKWPKAAYGADGARFSVDVSSWPVCWKQHHLSQFLKYPLKPLSLRAATGFYNRARASTLIRYPERFLTSLQIYIQNRAEVENGNNN